MIEALDIDSGAESYLPFAQHLLYQLKVLLRATGVNQGRKHLITPDGSGYIYVRTRRGTGHEDDLDEWYDYIKIEAGTDGYIARIASSLSSSVDLSNFSEYRISVDRGTFKHFPGYLYPESFASQISSSKVITGARTTGGASSGQFIKGVYTPFLHEPGGPFVGSFNHKYTDPDTQEKKTAIIAVKANLGLFDTRDGSDITRTGPWFSSASNPTYSVSKDGRLLVIESDVTLNNPPVRNVYQVDIDLGATNAAVSSSLNPAGPFGVQVDYSLTDVAVTTIPPGTADDAHWTETFSTSFTRDGEYPFSYGIGVDSNGNNEVKQITLTESVLIESDSSGEAEQSHLPSPLVGLQGFGTGAGTIVDSRSVTLTLPGGFSKEFELRDRLSTSTSSYTFSQEGAGSGTYAAETVDHDTIGMLGIIYCDASVPILFYEHITTESTTTTTSTLDHIDPGYTFILVTTVVQTEVIHTREVGVLFGNKHRVLFTETYNDPATSSSSTAPFSGSFAPPVASHSESSSTTNITVDPGYFKKLKWVTDFNSPNRGTPLNCLYNWTGGGGSTGVLFERDVQDCTGAFANNHRYWIGVRDKNRWVLGVFKKKNFAGTVNLNTMEFYSGNLNETKLMDHYIAWLKAAGEAKVPQDGAFLSAMEARDFSTYDVTLAAQSRLPLV